MRRGAAFLALAATLLAGCDRSAPEPAPRETRLPDEFRQQKPAPAAVEVSGATPMNQRVAVLGLLNKRNNLSQEIKLKPGEAQRIGDVIVRVSACERTAPWELPKETGAFVQVLVRQRGTDDQFARVFSGWLFRNSPSLNVVEHPIYDVWVKDCTMAFPDEEGAAPDADEDEAPRPAPRPAATPAATPAPTPSASPAPTPANQPTA